MGGWHVLIWSAVCVAGALLFLGIVAAEMEAVSSYLRLLDEQERKAYQKRLEEAEGYDAAAVEAAA